jgi:hypothetical protein
MGLVLAESCVGSSFFGPQVVGQLSHSLLDNLGGGFSSAARRLFGDTANYGGGATDHRMRPRFTPYDTCGSRRPVIRDTFRR